VAEFNVDVDAAAAVPNSADDAALWLDAALSAVFGFAAIA
jgi:hypothetical protein